MSMAPDVAALLGSAGTWELDAEGSSVTFVSTSLWGLTKVKGRFTGLSGGGSVGTDGSVSGELVIDARSVSTGKAKRDTHLRSDDFFKTSSQPEITYRASAVTPLGAQTARVTGTLTVAGTTRPLEVEARVEEIDDAGATVSTHLDIDRSDWGVTFRKMGMTKMSTPVEVTARLRRSSGGPAATGRDPAASAARERAFEPNS
jgi:polyisoprenoid-binding protein YceI